MILAVIPARGGSKRIPKKNIRNFHGVPIIRYSIEAALRSGVFDDVVVSTDDPEIMEVARTLGAAVPFVRPPELAGDHTGTNAVVKHAITWFRNQGAVVEYACCLYATAPFIQPAALKEGLDKLRTSGKDFAFSVTAFEFPVQRALRIKGSGGVEPVDSTAIGCRSQDLETLYHDAGQFYWGRAEAFIREVPLFSEASLPIVLPSTQVQDIDTLEDWARAELLFSAWKDKIG